jgi:hypothetical protein
MYEYLFIIYVVGVSRNYARENRSDGTCRSVLLVALGSSTVRCVNLSLVNERERAYY